jgi:asparagine synthase (glutamine-hydrolysing)
MCGICGAVAMEGRIDPAIAASLRRMTRALQHRGPDGEGFYIDDHAVLGHRRLAIIDREGGSQPLSDEHGRCWIAFNGEIYNHHELRHQLEQRGHRFRTHSDTEAIVHAYEEYGEACVDRLEGMFAFAIYDRVRRDLFLARDRLGKKPLFYAVLGGALHFGSEIKALRESPAWDGSPDLAQLESYLSLGYYLAPNTAYRHVRKLEPGHWLRLRAGRIEHRQYWDIPQFDTDLRQEADLLTDLESTLRARVAERLESEVPLGAFLSGGIDSGLVVSFMSERATREPVTVSVGFREAAHNELAPAALAARHFHTRHHEELIVPRLDEMLEPIVAAFDEPFADASAIPTWCVSRAARRHVTVALSGDGGDEIYGGYDFRYIPHALECAARNAMPTAAAGMFRSVGAAWPRSPRLPRPLRLATVLENIGRSAPDSYYADLCIIKPHEVRALLGRTPDRNPRESAVYATVTDPYVRCASPSPVQRAQYADFKIYLPNDVLVKVDRMSMLNGLEVRCPLLDRRVAELGFQIPSHRKTPRLRPKYLLKQLARRRLPSDVLSLPKHGFSAPVSEWLRGEYGSHFADDVLSPASGIRDLVDIGVVRRWFEEHRTGQRERASHLWAIWMLAIWNRIERSAPRPVHSAPPPAAVPC